jgi:hypothetical protein
MPELRRGFVEWLEQVREEPRLLWETPAVRYGAYGVCALLALWALTTFIGWVQPPNTTVRPEATTADYHIICTGADCGHHFVVNRKFGFRDFPVECPKCKRATGFAARKCNSRDCNGAWVIPVPQDDISKCPRCGTKFAAP